MATQEARSHEIVSRYNAGATLAQIAAEYSVTKQRIHQILRQAGVPGPVQLTRESTPIMTPERFCQCVEHIGWSLNSLADKLGLEHTRTRRWATGRHAVPTEIALWLEKLAFAHELNPAPKMTSTGGRWFNREQESAEA